MSLESRLLPSYPAIPQFQPSAVPSAYPLPIPSRPFRSEATSSALFFKHNSALGPPYNILVDTNFINFAIQNKLDLFNSFMDCLLAKCVPTITDCVMAELEKLGPKYRVALR